MYFTCALIKEKSHAKGSIKINRGTHISFDSVEVNFL